MRAFFAANGYYLCMFLGALSMTVLLVRRRNLFRFRVWQSILFSILLLLCGITGAKLLYILENPGTGASGMSFYGSVFLILLVMPVVGKFFSLDWGESLDACAPCVASILGFTRFGCYLSGCCGGTLATIGSFSFRWPTQGIESIADFLLVFYLMDRENSEKTPGKLYAILLTGYASLRFVIEFMRATDKDWFGLSHGQWFSIVAMLIGIVWLYITKEKK